MAMLTAGAGKQPTDFLAFSVHNVGGYSWPTHRLDNEEYLVRNRDILHGKYCIALAESRCNINYVRTNSTEGVYFQYGNLGSRTVLF